jgi:hypothetical protein
MKKLLTAGILGIAALAVPVGAALALPMAANAAPATNSTVKALTLSLNHTDTTSVSGSGTTDSPDGPVWAHDNLALQYTAVPDGANSYSVTITGVGTYDANANPITGVSWTGRGLINGTLKYEVTSPIAPNAKNLPLVEPSNVGQTTIMMDQLFGGHATITGGGSYNYIYTGIPGEPGGIYTQIG